MSDMKREYIAGLEDLDMKITIWEKSVIPDSDPTNNYGTWAKNLLRQHGDRIAWLVRKEIQAQRNNKI